MSATGRSDVRVENDFYGTPGWCADAIIRRLDLPRNTMILEPGCGTGAILRALGRNGYTNAVGVEIDAARAAMCGAKVDDFLEGDPPDAQMFGAAIGNPPYSLALEFTERAMAYAPCVVQLLRLNWLSSGSRKSFHRKHPAHVHVLPKRPSFCVSITCKAKCGWHVSLDPADKDRPGSCATCNGKVSVVTTDATEYAWFQWGGPGYVPGRWEILET